MKKLKYQDGGTFLKNKLKELYDKAGELTADEYAIKFNELNKELQRIDPNHQYKPLLTQEERNQTSTNQNRISEPIGYQDYKYPNQPYMIDKIDSNVPRVRQGKSLTERLAEKYAVKPEYEAKVDMNVPMIRKRTQAMIDTNVPRAPKKFKSGSNLGGMFGGLATTALSQAPNFINNPKQLKTDISEDVATQVGATALNSVVPGAGSILSTAAELGNKFRTQECDPEVPGDCAETTNGFGKYASKILNPIGTTTQAFGKLFNGDVQGFASNMTLGLVKDKKNEEKLAELQLRAKKRKENEYTVAQNKVNAQNLVQEQNKYKTMGDNFGYMNNGGLLPLVKYTEGGDLPEEEVKTYNANKRKKYTKVELEKAYKDTKEAKDYSLVKPQLDTLRNSSLIIKNKDGIHYNNYASPETKFTSDNFTPIDEYVKELPKTKSNLKDYSDYVNSDLYKERLKNEYRKSEGNSDLPEKAISLLTDTNLKNRKNNLKGVTVNKNISGENAAFYSPALHNIALDNNFSDEDAKNLGHKIQEVIPHEATHATLGSKKLMTPYATSFLPEGNRIGKAEDDYETAKKLNSKLTPKDFFDTDRSKYMGIINAGFSKDKRKYYQSPQEIHARLTSLRQSLKDEGITKSYGEKITPEQIKTLRSKYTKLPADTKMFLDMFSSDKASEINNEIAKNRSTKNDVFSAKKGGLLKYQNGELLNALKGKYNPKKTYLEEQIELQRPTDTKKYVNGELDFDQTMKSLGKYVTGKEEMLPEEFAETIVEKYPDLVNKLDNGNFEDKDVNLLKKKYDLYYKVKPKQKLAVYNGKRVIN